jgi:hypothetical protein
MNPVFSTCFLDFEINTCVSGKSGRLIMLLYPFLSTGAGLFKDPIVTGRLYMRIYKQDTIKNWNSISGAKLWDLPFISKL